MHQSNFHLENSKPKRKGICPWCGQRKLTYYVDDTGEYTQRFHDANVGRCDRENNCEYHYTPAEFFKNHPADLTRRCTPIRKVAPPKQPPSYISPDIMTATLSGYEHDNLFRFLARQFGQDEAQRLYTLYNVGHSDQWPGATVFWQIDSAGLVRAGKVMHYNEDGHRIKDPQRAHVSWVHSLLKLPDFHLCQCFFGEHLLLTNPKAKVVIVEREKTAIICAHFFPSFVWIATGGKAGCFNVEASQVLRGRDVMLMPDLGAEDEWNKKAEMLRPICKSVKVLTTLTDRATDEQRARGLDIADFLLEQTRDGPACG